MTHVKKTQDGTKFSLTTEKLGQVQGFSRRLLHRIRIVSDDTPAAPWIAVCFDFFEVLGIRDERLVQEFLRSGFTPRTAAAIELVPVAFVAWASGDVSEDECATAVLEIYDSQLTEFPKTMALVQTWLDAPPPAELWELWVRYVQCRLRRMSSDEKDRWHRSVLDQVRRVARASGGWLGIGSICASEQHLIDEIDQLFRRG